MERHRTGALRRPGRRSSAGKRQRSSRVNLVHLARDVVTTGGRNRGVRGQWANAVLNNGLGHYDEALSAAERASENHSSVGFSNWAVPELIEAAARTRMWDTATDAHRRLAEMTAASGTDWALGLEARSRALLRNGDEAENLYRLAIVRLERTRLRIELARAHLVYGEWLRRERRRIDARDQLRIAHKMFDTMGMEAFAERARRELRATGETAHKRGVKTRSDLTPQEAQVAKLARDGLSNPEIGARLFISARTAQYHLSKVFTKLGITSRAQLHRALRSGTRPASRLDTREPVPHLHFSCPVNIRDAG